MRNTHNNKQSSNAAQDTDAPSTLSTSMYATNDIRCQALNVQALNGRSIEEIKGDERWGGGMLAIFDTTMFTSLSDEKSEVLHVRKAQPVPETKPSLVNPSLEAKLSRLCDELSLPMAHRHSDAEMVEEAMLIKNEELHHVQKMMKSKVVQLVILIWDKKS